MTSDRERVVVRRRFVRERDDTDSERPLARCLRWVAEEEARTVSSSSSPLNNLVLAHETKDTLREYEAVSELELRRWALTPGVARHTHEVLAWPTKLYGDVDVALPADGVEQRFERALAALVSAAEQRLGVVCERAVVLDASSTAKFSRHFIVEMRDATSRRVRRFATPVECGAFVRSVRPAAALCDMAVYRPNNCLRVYGSTKLADARRCFVPLGDDVAVAPERLDWATLERSLVTWPRVADDDGVLHVERSSSPSLKRSSGASRARSLASSTTSCDGATDIVERLSAAITLIAEVDIVGVKRSNKTGYLLLASTSLQCAIKGAEHGSNTIYFVVDEQRRRYKQLCHSRKCSKSGVVWSTYGDSSEARASSAPPPPPRKRACTPDAVTSYPQRVCNDFLALMAIDGGDESDGERDRLRASAPV